MPVFRNRKTRIGSWVVGLILAAISSFVIVSFCFIGIQKEVEKTIEQEMSDVTRQYASAVQVELRAKANLLRGISTQMPDDLDGILQDLKELENLKELYHFKRAGYITPEGQVLSTNGLQADVSDDSFWKMISNQKISLSGALKDEWDSGDKRINIFTVPIRKEDNEILQGYLFIAYDSDMLQELFAFNSFGGEGMSYVMLRSGDIIVGSKNPNVNVFDVLGKESEVNAESLSQIRQDFQTGKSGMIGYQADEERYMFYMPLSANESGLDLYLATVIPAKVLDDRVSKILDIAKFMVLFIVLSVVIFLSVGLMMYRLYHKEVYRLAYIDPMTGWDNYTAFRIKMREKKMPGHIVSVDLAEFKIINNICGVKRADVLLQEMWRVLESQLKNDELGCHISGDQYVLFFKELNTEKVIERVKFCNEQLLQLPVKLDMPKIVPRFGICLMESSEHPEDGYGKANLAKKTIAHRRDQFYAVYGEELQQNLVKDKWMEDEFDLSLENESFEAWYQPKFNPVSGEMTGAEALVRWRGEDGTLRSPGIFIPLFERNGMIARLDEYMFRQVCKNQKAWMEEGRKVVPVSINVSRTSLHFPMIVERYKDIIQKIGVPQHLVQIEITESAIIDNKVAEEQIKNFREAGFILQLDDFGQGYSSLATLNMQCFHIVKVDKSLIDDMKDEYGKSLLYYVFNLVHGLGLETTAEGVEKQEQVDYLKQLNCNHIQGYFYSRPKPKVEFEAMLEG